jgi:hypothetical protein
VGTFYEIYNGRLYARTQGDTVHMNSWILLWNGGYDKDSRYIPRVDSTDQHLWMGGVFATGAVLEAAGRVGSPIGFRSQVALRLTPGGLKSVPAQSSMYPDYEPASVFHSARMGGYWRMRNAGKAFALARAEDADGGLDNSVKDQVLLAETVDNGGGTTAERELRRQKVLTFYVDKAPSLVRHVLPLFRPEDGESITTTQWSFLLRGMDLDPFDPDDPNLGPGGPSLDKTILRYKITLYGKNLDGRDTSWTYLGPSGLPYIQSLGGDQPVDFIPGGTMTANPFASGEIRVSIQICDCADCEIAPGQGRCVDGIDPLTGAVLNASNVITVNYTRPAGEPGLGTTSATGGRPGPGGSGRGD